MADERDAPGKMPVKKDFAARMMAKMGYKKGEGLGAEGKGRLAPIESQLRPQGVGLGAVKEKSKQAKEEEKRAAAFRGEELDYSSEEERKRKREAKLARRAQTGSGPASGTATPRRRKAKFVTVEEIQADLKGLNVPNNVLETAVDLSGKALQQEAKAIGDFVSAKELPTESEADKARRRIHQELLAVAETRHALIDKQKYLDGTSMQIVAEIDGENKIIGQLQLFQKHINRLQEVSENEYNIDTALERWEETTKALEDMEVECKADVEPQGLQEVAVAAIHPLFRRATLDWDPMDDPTFPSRFISRAEHVLGIVSEAKENALILDGTTEEVDFIVNRKSTSPYETMIYTLWLPKVQSIVNSAWEVEDPQPLIAFVDNWRPLLPRFIYAKLVSQLIVPRLTSALASWKPSRSGRKSHSRPPPDAWIFPWLAYVPSSQLDPNASEGLMTEVKRRFRNLLSNHSVDSGIPSYLAPWKKLLGDVYQHILTTRLLPRLANYLATHLLIDPSDQSMDSIQKILAYMPLFPPSTMAELFTAEFFPKFHSTLHQWLTSDEPDYGEINEWYTWWKSEIPDSFRDLPPMAAEWTKAIETMGLAMDLGDQAAAQLPAPEAKGRSLPTGQSTPLRVPDASANTKIAATPTEEPTFKEVVEDWCVENDLLFVALREAHETTGSPLFRITASADQKGGVVVYLKGDVIWVRERKDRSSFKPMALDEALVERASSR